MVEESLSSENLNFDFFWPCGGKNLDFYVKCKKKNLPQIEQETLLEVL